MSDLSHLSAQGLGSPVERTCASCAKAKVKCDKKRPKCGRCTRLGVECLAQLRGRGRPPNSARKQQHQQQLANGQRVMYASSGSWADSPGGMSASEPSPGGQQMAHHLGYLAAHGARDPSGGAGGLGGLTASAADGGGQGGTRFVLLETLGMAMREEVHAQGGRLTSPESEGKFQAVLLWLLKVLLA